MSEQMQALIKPVVEGLGCKLWGIEHLPLGKHATLKIYIDAEGGVDVADCARVSQQVSSLLDAEVNAAVGNAAGDVANDNNLGSDISSDNSERLAKSIPDNQATSHENNTRANNTHVNNTPATAAKNSAINKSRFLLQGEYTLEVSSPGLDRRLFKLEHYSAWAGSEIRLTLKRPFEGKRKYAGMLIGVEGDEVVLKQGEEAYLFPIEQIDRANVVPNFSDYDALK